MITNNDTTLLVLNDLLLTARDARKGFETAAERVKETELQRLFADCAKQRAKFERELDERIRTLRGDPMKLPNPAAAAHRAWMAAEAAMASNEAHAILSECERGEDMAVKAYIMALKAPDIDRQSRDLIQGQYELIHTAHDRIRQLRDSATYAYR